MTERITLRGEAVDAGSWSEVEFNDSPRWPVQLHGPDGSSVVMSDREAVHLMQVLQQRYPLEALSRV